MQNDKLKNHKINIKGVYAPPAPKNFEETYTNWSIYIVSSIIISILAGVILSVIFK